MTVPDQPSSPKTGIGNVLIDGSSKPLAALDWGGGLAGGGPPKEKGSVGDVSGASFPAFVVDGDPLGVSVFDGTGGGTKGTGEAYVEDLGSSVGPGPSVVAGNNTREGSLMKLRKWSVSQLAQAGSIDCNPVVG